MFLFAQIFTHLFIFYVLWNNHSPIMDFIHSQIMPKKILIKLSIPFTNIFYKKINFYNKLF
jgi:hypothetical protein